MTSKVQLYVYDLSNGMARQMSSMLLGTQINGVWHTSVAVYEKEIFYGQGIHITWQGQTPYGLPVHIIDIGETEVDEETFHEYLQEMRQQYTADKYHLLDFNCNTFTDECVGFLTGGTIPSWIKDLPAVLMSTPLGAALRPTIDQMFRRTVPNDFASAGPYNQVYASSLVQNIATTSTPNSTSVVTTTVTSVESGSNRSPETERKPADNETRAPDHT